MPVSSTLSEEGLDFPADFVSADVLAPLYCVSLAGEESQNVDHQSANNGEPLEMPFKGFSKILMPRAIQNTNQHFYILINKTLILIPDSDFSMW